MSFYVLRVICENNFYSFENYFGFIIETVRGIHEMCTCTYVLIHKVDVNCIVIHSVQKVALLRRKYFSANGMF